MLKQTMRLIMASLHSLANAQPYDKKPKRSSKSQYVTCVKTRIFKNNDRGNRVKKEKANTLKNYHYRFQKLWMLEKRNPD